MQRLVEQRKNAAGNRRRIAVLAAVSLAILFVSFILPEGMLRSTSDISSASVLLERVMQNIGNVVAVFANTHTAGNYTIVICRFTAAFVTGAVLGTCGAVYQSAFRNPLASPSTLGVVSGCLVGAIVFYLFLNQDWLQASLTSMSTAFELLHDMSPLDYFWVVYGRAVCAVVGGVAVVAVPLLITRVVGSSQTSSIVLVVVGQVIALVASSLVDTVRYYLEVTGDDTRATLVQLAGGAPFGNILSLVDLAAVCIPMICGLVVLMLLRNRVNLLSFSEDEARAMGMDVGKFKTVIVMICTVIVGISVGFCGPIAFVGFVVPHIARRIVGSDNRYLMPASLVVGAIFLTLALFVTLQLDIKLDQGVNLITTGIGCVVFLIVAYRGKGGAHAWH